MAKTKNDLAWEKLFNKYKILREIERKGFYIITSRQINEYREARLATKFDHKSNLPKLFRENGLSILPITRGSYIISSFEAYKEFDETNPEVIKIPFPQANSMKRLINLCEILYNDEMTKEEITTTYDFDPRQTNYYTDAGRYLGLIDKRREDGEIKFFLTEKGKKLFKMNLKVRQLKFIELILEHKAFNKTLKEYFRTGQMPNKSTIVRFMKESNLYNIRSDSTFFRRAQTISSWISWILNIVKM